jgi:small subunit ribosomal protein S13
MARLVGVEIPNNKRIEIALTAIYGIGRSLAHVICDKANIDYATKAKDLTDVQVTALRDAIEATTKVEGDLRTEIHMNIKRLKEIHSYRGMRHIRKLPARGQRTKTNSRSVRGGGSRKAVAGKKKAPGKK